MLGLENTGQGGTSLEKRGDRIAAQNSVLSCQLVLLLAINFHGGKVGCLSLHFPLSSPIVVRL